MLFNSLEILGIHISLNILRKPTLKIHIETYTCGELIIYEYICYHNIIMLVINFS